VSNRACYGAIRFIVAGAKFSAMTRITLRIDFDGSRALAEVVGANGVNLGSRWCEPEVAERAAAVLT